MSNAPFLSSHSYVWLFPLFGDAQNKDLLLIHPQSWFEIQVLLYTTPPLPSLGLFYRDFSQGNPLDRRPDDGQAANLHAEHVDLIGALPHEVSEALDSVDRSDVAMMAYRCLSAPKIRRAIY